MSREASRIPWAILFRGKLLNHLLRLNKLNHLLLNPDPWKIAGYWYKNAKNNTGQFAAREPAILMGM